MTEKTSVLMSVYNKENSDHFDLSLQSILIDQTHKPDEFVLVCDGPLTPELDRVICEYQKKIGKAFKVFRCEHNQGLGKALNFGLDKCTYDIIIRADSDDISVPNRVEVQLRYLITHPDVDIVSSFIDEFDEDWNSPVSVKKLPITNEKIVRMAKFRNPINHMAVAFRKHVILSIGSYQHVKYVEDYDLWLRAIANGVILGNIDQVLVHARVGNGMIYRRGNKEYIRSWRILNKYMLAQKMISPIEYARNIISVVCFVFTPPLLKNAIYKIFLR